MLFKQLKFKSRIRKTAAIATIAVMLVTEAFAQQSGSARRPPAVQKAMDEAVIAAKKQDYATAIRLFSEALALAPRDSQIMLNLALAYNRLGKLPCRTD